MIQSTFFPKEIQQDLEKEFQISLAGCDCCVSYFALRRHSQGGTGASSAHRPRFRKRASSSSDS
jgi:hypothetical protein